MYVNVLRKSICESVIDFVEEKKVLGNADKKAFEKLVNNDNILKDFLTVSLLNRLEDYTQDSWWKDLKSGTSKLVKFSVLFGGQMIAVAIDSSAFFPCCIITATGGVVYLGYLLMDKYLPTCLNPFEGLRQVGSAIRKKFGSAIKKKFSGKRKFEGNTSGTKRRKTGEGENR